MPGKVLAVAVRQDVLFQPRCNAEADNLSLSRRNFEARPMQFDAGAGYQAVRQQRPDRRNIRTHLQVTGDSARPLPHFDNRRIGVEPVFPLDGRSLPSQSPRMATVMPMRTAALSAAFSQGWSGTA